MPKIKLKSKAVEQKSGFEPYDGPEPTKRGFYRGVIKKLTYGTNNSGSVGFFAVVELEAEAGDPKDHAKFNGYPMFVRNVITETSDGSPLKEGSERNLGNFLAALGAGADPDVITEASDDSHAVVTKVGKVNPIGRVVNVDVQIRPYEGENRPEVGGIFPFKETEGAAKKSGPKFVPDEEDESDLMESDEAEGDEEYDARVEELKALGIPALRKLLKEDYDLPTSGKKDELIERILEHEFAEEDEDGGAAALADDEDETDEDEAEEAEESDEDEEEDEEEEDEDGEEEDEDEDEDESAERRAELESFDRAALKKALKAVAPDFKVFTRHTEADLIDAIIEAEFGEETPF